ncbi:MAG: hypothetical protein HC822_05630, partial [Oscillochloris sp.]|nr:hypothetical protein [Oscillochloris sp.]
AAPWLGIADRGVDGGWWLLPLAGRWTSTPPVIFTYGPGDYVAEVMAIGDTVTSYQPDNQAALHAMIDRAAIDYLYLTDRSGPLRADQFVGRPGFNVVYAQDGVTILAVESQS